jgi:plasmid stabilization system protein ParE
MSPASCRHSHGLEDRDASEGSREWVVKQTLYLLMYAIESDLVQIVAVIHSKQRWPDVLQ